MRLNNSTLFVIATFAVSLGGCVASQTDVQDVYRRQARLEAKTELLSREVEALRQTAQASSNDERIAQLEERIKNMEQTYADLNARLFQLEGRGLSSGLPPAPGPGTISGGEAVSPEDSPEDDLYRQAYTNLSQGNYKEARQQFKSFISENPDSSQSADALYWVAESYYREGKFEEAILEFQRFIDNYSQDSKVPLAFLKQGLSLINIGRKEEARLFLQTLIDKFPESEEAKIAREKLKELESTG